MQTLKLILWCRCVDDSDADAKLIPELIVADLIVIQIHLLMQLLIGSMMQMQIQNEIAILMIVSDADCERLRSRLVIG